MKAYFYELSHSLPQLLNSDESIALYYQGEESRFCRMNKAKIRQGMDISQHQIDIRFEKAQRQTLCRLDLSLNYSLDHSRLKLTIEELRSHSAFLPSDPLMSRIQRRKSSEFKAKHEVVDDMQRLPQVLSELAAYDLVGVFSSGMIFRGYANSFGQTNWFESSPFQLDFSLYSHGDKAAKANYSGTQWSDQEFSHCLSHAKRDFEVLKRPTRIIDPGHYRSYFAPSAVKELLMISDGGYGAKARRAKNSCLLKLIEEKSRFSEQFELEEDYSNGFSPPFNRDGEVRPDRVPLITRGKNAGDLVSLRSAKEFDLVSNGANDSESPESLVMSGGNIKDEDVLKELGTGLYINNLWYLNFSDLSACRITGMTRFASFWVENGEVVAPINVMRFDDSFYRMFGDSLAGLTDHQSCFVNASTYNQRNTGSVTVPGALVDGVCFTL